MSQFRVWICLSPFACLTAMTSLAAAQGTGTPSPPVLKRPISIVDAVTVAFNISQDGQAATALFDNLQVGTNVLKDMPLVVTRTATVDLPISGNTMPLQIQEDIRGYVFSQPGAGASLVIRSCGQTTVVDLASAKADAKKFPRPATSATAKRRPKGVDLDSDFYYRFVGTLPANARAQVTFYLLVDKDQDQANGPGALLAVDSLDVTISTDKGK